MTDSTVVRTRFAPSPTGYLHIGGARTALFCYLLAKKHDGQFLLRIEDTDQTRNIAEAGAKLMEDLRWLGLEWDEGPDVGGPTGPYTQSERRPGYDAAIDALLDAGDAYFAWETPDELDAMRAAAQAKAAEFGGKGFRYPRPATLPTRAEADAAAAAGKPVVVRLKFPDGDITVHDEVLGDVTYARQELDDFVIRKADGWPTYHLACVVDDEAMQISHVIRGKEHLANTPKHIALQRLLGYRTPNYAHVPLIFNIDGSRMSKRDKDKAVRAAYTSAAAASDVTAAEAAQLAAAGNDAAFAQWVAAEIQLDSDGLEALARRLGVPLPEINVHDFRVNGYLPEVVVNFIALLGWSAGDDREKYTVPELTQAFSLDRVGKTDAKFDREKLLSFNTDAGHDLPAARLTAGLRDYLAHNPDGGLVGADDRALETVVELCRGFRTLGDIETKTGSLFRAADELIYDEAAVKKWLLKGQTPGAQTLRALRDVLDAQADWSAPALDGLIRGFAEQHELGLGKVGQPLRIAAAGNTVSPGISDTLALVGKQRMLERVDRLIEYLATEHGA